MRLLAPLPRRSAALKAVREPTLGGVVDAILRSWARDQAKPRWGEKTPNNVRYWREILGWYPDAQVIHIVRDGRDVAASFHRATFGPKTPLHAAERWVDYLDQMEQMQATMAAEKFLLVSYEDLLAGPEEVLTRICSFLGQDYDATMLEFYKEKIEIPISDGSVNAQNLRKPVLRNNSGKWRNSLDDDDVRAFEAIAGETLTRYGYDLTLERPKLTTADRLYYRWVQNPPRRGLNMLRNRWAQRELLAHWRLRCRLMLVDPLRSAR